MTDVSCECGHSRNTHAPCCVSPCGCDGFSAKELTDADVDAMLALPDEERFSSPERKAQMWKKFQRRLKGNQAIARIKMLLRNEDWKEGELEGLTLVGIETALQHLITAKNNYRGLYAKSLQENQELRAGCNKSAERMEVK